MYKKDCQSKSWMPKFDIIIQLSNMTCKNAKRYLNFIHQFDRTITMDLSTGFTGKGYEGSQVTEKFYYHSNILQHRVYDSCRSDVHSILLI